MNPLNTVRGAMTTGFVLAIVLMMVVLLVPPLFMKRSPRRTVPPPTADTIVSRPTPTPTIGAQPGTPPPTATPEAATEDTVTVLSELYSYRFSTRGGRLIAAELRR